MNSIKHFITYKMLKRLHVKTQHKRILRSNKHTRCNVNNARNEVINRTIAQPKVGHLAESKKWKHVAALYGKVILDLDCSTDYYPHLIHVLTMAIQHQRAADLLIKIHHHVPISNQDYNDNLLSFIKTQNLLSPSELLYVQKTIQKNMNSEDL